MKDRLLFLYELNKIDKELGEISSERGDLPEEIEEMKLRKDELDKREKVLEDELEVLVNLENKLVTENEAFTKRIDKNDIILRSGGVNSNDEYNALAKEIEDAYANIGKNEEIIKNDITGKKQDIGDKVGKIQTELDEIEATLNEKEKRLQELIEETEEEEKELNDKRKIALKKVVPEDLAYYEDINSKKFGDSMAIVRKGSCLGCFNSIPPQRCLEIRMAEQFFKCESCGRILIAEENLKT
jgi:uncharacterized protein